MTGLREDRQVFIVRYDFTEARYRVVAIAQIEGRGRQQRVAPGGIGIGVVVLAGHRLPGLIGYCGVVVSFIITEPLGSPNQPT